MTRFFFLCALVLPFCLQGQTRKIILDADTGNEVDDPYAIVRALIEPTWEVTALHATQWQSSQWASANSMEDSHRLNQMLVAYLQMEGKVPTLRGGVRRMDDWGNKGQHSAATHEIIGQARELEPGEKLDVVVLGALTNVASALWIAPDIEPFLRVYWLGLSYNFESGSHGRTTFNAVMDPQATDLMLSSEVEMHILPNPTSLAMRFEFTETYRHFHGVHPLTDFLLNRWTQHVDGGRYERIIWDLGIVGAMLHPEWCHEIKGEGFDNPNVWMYKELDGDAIRDEFFRMTLEYVEKLPGYAP